jgi:hypothetical protein
MSATFPVSTAAWSEPPTAGNAALTQLTPYRTTAGYWVLLPSDATPPAGATRGGVVQGATYNTLQTAVTGRRLRRASAGVVFFR